MTLQRIIGRFDSPRGRTNPADNCSCITDDPKGGVLVGLRDWVKGHVAEANEAAKAVMDERRQPPSKMVAKPRPAFPTAQQDPAALITQRLWSETPNATVSVVWRPSTRGEGGASFWLGRTVDPSTYETVDVFDDQNEAKRRQAVAFAVAGTHVRRRELNRPEFNAGRPVMLVPDPRNKYDRHAIEVRDVSGRTTVGFVPKDRYGETFAQGLLHTWLAHGPIAALIISERSWFDDKGEPTQHRGGITVLAGPRLECVQIPEQGDADHADFTAARLEGKANAWPTRRMELRREIDTSDDAEDRHFAIQFLIEEAYRLRDAHPEALDDAIAACKEQIDLAPRVAALMRQRYDRPLPAHRGYKQLAIILEKQKAYTQAIELAQQARDQGWDGDWDKRLDRIRRKQP